MKIFFAAENSLVATKDLLVFARNKFSWETSDNHPVLINDSRAPSQTPEAPHFEAFE